MLRPLCPQVQRCSAQVSVFTFLPDVPLSMVECGREPVRAPGAHPGGGTRVPITSGGVFWLWSEIPPLFLPAAAR